MKKRTKIFIVVAVLLVVASVWVTWGNVVVTVTEYVVECEGLPAPFSGFRIAQISDLHNAEFGEGNVRLINKLKNTRPDIIVLTGDTIDSHRTNVAVAISFCEEAVKIAPTYFITGNHEARLDTEYKELKKAIENFGVVVLENESIMLEIDGEKINLVGIHDPAFMDVSEEEDCEKAAVAELERLTSVEYFDLVLVHRPGYFKKYAATEADLLLCGHHHGGQFRLPFIGGLFAPGQGFFPEYDSGVYAENGTTMVISRGIGNSSFPIRFNNPPEIVVVELLSK
jgi:predicted MPP superfamily phosphohydrolase